MKKMKRNSDGTVSLIREDGTEAFRMIPPVGMSDSEINLHLGVAEDIANGRALINDDGEVWYVS